MVTGKASNFTIGFTKVLIKPKTRAITTAHHHGVIDTPGSIYAVIPTANADIISVENIVCNIKFLSLD
jgi:hypothetical protein